MARYNTDALRALSMQQIWHRLTRKMRGKERLNEFDAEHACTFVLSTGRAGTQTIAKLAALGKNVFAHHEPSPVLYGLSQISYTCPEKFRTTSQRAEVGQKFSGELYTHTQENTQTEQILHEAFLAMRTDLFRESLICGRGYVETSPQATFLAPTILGVVPNVRFIHLVRDPIDVIASGLRRKWYLGQTSDRTRISPREGDPFHQQWGTLTAVEKNAWLWAETNRWIRAFCQTLPQERQLFLKSEDIFNNDTKTMALLFEFIGATVPSERKIENILGKKLNQQTEGESSKESISLGSENGELQTFVHTIAEQMGYQWES